MSVSITGKLNKAPNEFSAGDSTGFGLRLGQQYYDRDTKQKEWTNYECVIFARQQGQIDFYRQALVEGAIVAVSGKEQKIRSFDGNNGTVLSIEILNAGIDNVFAPMGSAPTTPPQPAPQTPPAVLQTYSPQNPAGEPAQMPIGWGNGYAPTAKCNGGTLEQVWKKFKGDMNAAIQGGYLAQSNVINDFDDNIPF